MVASELGNRLTRERERARARIAFEGELPAFERLDRIARPKHEEIGDRAQGGQMFDRLDTNKDGNVSREEFAAAHAGKDGDAKGPGEHRMGERGGMMGAMMMLHMADANKDGAVSRDEFLAAHARMFDMGDANKDGKLTPEERKAHHAQMRQKMGAKRGGMDHSEHADHTASK